MQAEAVLREAAELSANNQAAQRQLQARAQALAQAEGGCCAAPPPTLPDGIHPPHHRAISSLAAALLTPHSAPHLKCFLIHL